MKGKLTKFFYIFQFIDFLNFIYYISCMILVFHGFEDTVDENKIQIIVNIEYFTSDLPYLVLQLMIYNGSKVFILLDKKL